MNSRDLALQSLHIAIEQLLESLDQIPTHDIEHLAYEITETIPIARTEENNL
jgi:hypothetical protein